jgi:hypothetical protein
MTRATVAEPYLGVMLKFDQSLLRSSKSSKVVRQTLRPESHANHLTRIPVQFRASDRQTGSYIGTSDLPAKTRRNERRKFSEQAS